MPVANIDNISQDIDLLRDFIVPKLLIRRVVKLAEEEGILRLIRKLGSFNLDEICSIFGKELGYVLNEPVRKRMVMNLLNILVEAGYLEKSDNNRYHLNNNKEVTLPMAGTAGVAKLKEIFSSEISFYNSCIEYTGRFLRGAPPLYGFGSQYSKIWEAFLGNYAFGVARMVLLQSLRIEDKATFQILDLCYGTGQGLEFIHRRYPKTRITAIDFTDMFQKQAHQKIELLRRGNSSQETEDFPVKWIPSTEWKGFGNRLPFMEKTFDVVFFACADPYIPSHVRCDVYKDIYRILKPGGGLGVMTRSYPDPENKYITNNWAKMAIYLHDFAEGVCENWHGFYGVEETLNMFKKLGFIPRSPFFNRFSLLDHALWGLEKPSDG